MLLAEGAELFRLLKDRSEALFPWLATHGGGIDGPGLRQEGLDFPSGQFTVCTLKIMVGKGFSSPGLKDGSAAFQGMRRRTMARTRPGHYLTKLDLLAAPFRYVPSLSRGAR